MALFRRVRIGYQNKDASETYGVEAPLWNARQLPVKPTMMANGFQLVEFDHGITDFSTEAQKAGTTEKQIKERLYPLFQKVLRRECPGCTDVIVFNHGLRASSVPQAAKAPAATDVKPPVKEAHSDFSPSISPLVVKKLAPHVDLKKSRYALVNLWMSVDQKNPVMKTPLAFLDAGSVPPEDLVDFFEHSGKVTEMKEWTGQMEPSFRTKLKNNCPGLGNDQHAWFYFPKMMKNEAVIFTQYDSSSSQAQCCIHAAIDVEEIGAQPLPERQSCEVRALVIWDADAAQTVCCNIWPWAAAPSKVAASE